MKREREIKSEGESERGEIERKEKENEQKKRETKCVKIQKLDIQTAAKKMKFISYFE